MSIRDPHTHGTGPEAEADLDLLLAGHALGDLDEQERQRLAALLQERPSCASASMSSAPPSNCCPSPSPPPPVRRSACANVCWLSLHRGRRSSPGCCRR